MRHVLSFGILFMLITHFVGAQTLIAHNPITKLGALDSLKSTPNISKSISSLDTLIRIEKLDSLTGRVDSLKQRVHTYLVKTDSIQAKLSTGLEKLTSLPDVPVEKLQEQISSLHERLNQQNQSINEGIDKLNDKVTTTSEKLQEGASSLADRLDQKNQAITNEIKQVNDKLSGMSGQAPTNVPVDIPLDLDGVTEKLDIDVPEIEFTVPDLKIPELDQIKELDLQQYSKSLNVDKIVPTDALEAPGINADLDILKKVPELSEQINKISSIDISSVDDATKLIEDRVASMEPVQDLMENAKAITAQQAEYEALLQKYKDTKALEKEILEKAKNVVNDKLNQYSPAFQNAQTKISKARKLFPIAQSFKDGKFFRVNELKEIPRYERFVPGLSISSNYAERFHLNLGLQTRYLLTSKFSVGVGGFSGISFGKTQPYWLQSDKFYGYRLFGTIETLKTMFAQVEFSQSFGRIAINNKAFPANGSSAWILGLGHRFNISRKFGGSFLVLYPVLKGNDMAEQSKLLTRIEINFNTKKRTKILPPP